MTDFNTLVGQTIIGVDCDKKQLRISTKEGNVYVMVHEQECMDIEVFAGDTSSLLNERIYSAEVVSDQTNSYIWTFYRLETKNKMVAIRWYGPNGHFSESVSFIEIIS